MHEEIISALKEQYSRDLRKQVVKSILGHEKSSDKEAIKSSYKIVNQIFSYVIDSLGWNISAGTNTWDTSPLKIMSEVFPIVSDLMICLIFVCFRSCWVLILSNSGLCFCDRHVSLGPNHVQGGTTNL